MTQSSRTVVEVDNVISVQSDGAILVKSGVHQQLDAREVHDFLKYAATKYINVISSAPPVQPPGGTVLGGTGTVEVPDSSELEYLAGKCLNSKFQRTFQAIHTGVQLCEDESYADLLTAFLLFAACSEPMNDLGTFRVTLSTMSEQLYKFMSERKPLLETDFKTGHYCKTKVVTVQLLCDCFRPWIEGSTSVAIYGKQQKEFNMHLCCK